MLKALGWLFPPLIPSIGTSFFRSGIPGVEHFTWRIFSFWSFAVACWIFDRVLCDIWLQLGTPYLHAVWHLFSSLAA
jgi:alkaline ceramidase